MKREKWLRSLACCTFMAVPITGCGGGGGNTLPGGDGAVIVTSPPTSTPPPPPPPPPPPVAAAFPPSALTASQTFASLGYSLGYDVSGSSITGGSGVDAAEQVVLRYNASGGGSYEVEIPGFLPGRLILNSDTGGRGYTATAGLASNSPQLLFLSFSSGLLAPNLQLNRSNFAYWTGQLSAEQSRRREGFFAFGVPAPAAAIPATGTRTYTSIARGITELYTRASGAMTFRYVDGLIALQFNLAARTVSGALQLGTSELGREESFGQITLSGNLGPVGGTTFSGTISVPGFGQTGTFEGQFMGPDASEVIIRWRAPVRIPSDDRNTAASGIIVGKVS